MRLKLNLEPYFPFVMQLGSAFGGMYDISPAAAVPATCLFYLLQFTSFIFKEKFSQKYLVI